MARNRILAMATAAFALAAGVLWQYQRPVVHAIEGSTMGSGWSVRYAGPRNVDEAAVRAALEAELADLDLALSGYRDDSTLMKLNRAPVGVWVDIPPDLFRVLVFGLKLWRESGGAFDMTVKPLVRAWGFGAAERRDTLPEASAIDAARARLGSDRLELSADGRRARRLADIELDTDGVAPGYAAGVLSAWLAAHGFPNHLVEVGGEMHAAGHRPDGHGWRVGIEAPEFARGHVERIAEVSDMAITTAGDYRDYVEIDRHRYTHIIDPVTGRPVEHALASVTILAPGLPSADGYATAIMVMGPEKGLALADRLGFAAYLILRNPDGTFRETWNRAFAPLLAD